MWRDKGAELGEAAISWPKLATPLGDTVRFVHGDHRKVFGELGISQKVPEVLILKAHFWRC